MNVLRVMAVLTAVFLIGAFAIVSYISGYCTDEIPDTSSIYVYTVDRGVDELNRKYLKNKKIHPADESRYIVYEDIPDIAGMAGVEAIYIFDDALFNDFSEAANSEEAGMLYASVPTDAITYFGAPSGIDSMFRLNPDNNPAPGAEYAFVSCSEGYSSWAVEPQEYYPLYYKYDESTWADFSKRLENYLVEYDAISDVSMLIKMSSGSAADSAALQDALMEKYPGSNYLSAEFARVFMEQNNRQYWRDVAVFALVTLAVTVAIEVAISVIVKKVR